MSRVNEWGQPIGPSMAGWVPPPLPSRVTLRGMFACVIPLDVERHARELFEAFAAEQDGRRWTYLPYGPFDGAASFRHWLEESVAGIDPLFFTILDERSGAPAGLASYLRISPASGCIEVGHLNFSARLARSAAATEAMYLMMKHAFDLGYRRYEWKCDVLNAPSRAAAERLGFVYEGTFRQATVYKARSRDTAWYAVINAHWPTLESAFQRWLDPANFDAAGIQRLRLSELTRTISAAQT
jgi:RimJ/RimL family protein N-acetyltransferase